MIKASVILPFKTGLDRDVAINTFHFGAPINPGGLFQDVADLLIAGYNNLGDDLSFAIDRTRCIIELRDIDPANGEQTGSPQTVDLELPAADSSDPLPLEVALCMSYGAETANVSERRTHRGRVYFGPFEAGTLDTQGILPHPTSGIIQKIAEFGANLRTDSIAADVLWCVWSRKNGELYAVDGGWVDDEWDTQRRRGVESTFRQYWGGA